MADTSTGQASHGAGGSEGGRGSRGGTRAGRNELLPFQVVLALTAAAIAGIIAVLGEIRNEFGFSETAVGVVVATGFLGGFVAQVSLARFADRGHGKLMAFSGLMLSAAALLVMVFASGVALWMVSRAALGFGGGMTIPAMRRAASVLDPARVGENLGRLVVGEILGFIVGPVLSGGLAYVGGLRLPFAFFAAVMVAFLPFVWRLPPDKGSLDMKRRGVVAWDLLRNRRLQGALIFVSGYFVVIGAWEAVFPVMFADRGGEPWVVGVAFMCLAMPIVFVSPFAGRMADRVGPVPVCMVSMVVVALVTTTYGWLPGLLIPIIVMFPAGIADGLGFVAMQVVVCRAVPEERQAAALGLMGASELLGAGVAAIPAAALYQEFGASPAWVTVGLVMLVMVLGGGLRVRGTHPVSGPQAVAGTPTGTLQDPGLR